VWSTHSTDVGRSRL